MKIEINIEKKHLIGFILVSVLLFSGIVIAQTWSGEPFHTVLFVDKISSKSTSDGAVEFKKIKITEDAGNGKVLTSNNDGVGEWKDPETSPWDLISDGIKYSNGGIGVGNINELNTLLGIHSTNSIFTEKNIFLYKDSSPNFGMGDGDKGNIVFGDDIPRWAIEYESESSGLNFWIPFGGSDQNYKLFIKDDNGNVGIGTKNPSEKLHVNGNLSVDGNLKLNSYQGACPLSGSKTGIGCMFETSRSSGSGDLDATCASNMIAITGGCYYNDDDGAIKQNRPVGENIWRCEINGDINSNPDIKLKAFVVCIDKPTLDSS